MELAIVVGFQSHVKHHALSESVTHVVMVYQPVKSLSSPCLQRYSQVRPPV